MATALKTTQPNSRSPKQRLDRRRSHLQAVKPAPTPSRSRRARSPLATASATPRSVPHPSVRQLPTRRTLPLWLRLLIQLQRGSLVATFVLVAAALVMYGSTIYMQQHWSREYHKLKTMQRSERQMIAAEASLKNQLIQQAEQPGAGLVPRTSAHTIFLEPSPDRAAVPINPVVRQATPASESAPLSY